MNQTQAVLDELVKFIEEHGYSPTVRELGERLNIVSSLAQYHLLNLRVAGCIEWEPRKARTIKVKRSQVSDVRL